MNSGQTMIVLTVEQAKDVIETTIRCAMTEALKDRGSDEMTSEQVAIELELSEKYVRKLARDEELKGTRRGRKWRFKRADVEAYKAGTTSGSVENLAEKMIAAMKAK